ncbi:hypothetical protein DIPPA_15992 [Diplonema papillatum]|nr:hypothetical protein DIPPA_15992 [Diplonema papillatum]
MNALRDQCRVVEAQKAQIQRDAKAEVMQVQDRARQLEMDKVQLEVGAKNEVALLKERSRHQDQERADFKNEITVLKDVNRRQEVENNDLSSELSYTKKALSRSDTTLSAQQERSRKVEDENAALKERCYQTDAELMLARERCRQHEDNLAEYKKTTRPLKDELAAAFESVESKSTAVTSLNKELATVKLEVATLGQEVAEKSRTIARLHEEAALAEERIADRKNNREAEHAKELQTLREKHAKELQTLREKYATEVGELRAAFLSKEREVDESSSKWEATNAELHQALAEVDNLRQRLHDAVEDIGRLERESEKYSENARANQSPSMASARDCPSEQEDGVLGASVEELQGQLAENAQELAKARDIMSESADELEHAQAEIHSLQSEVKEWKAHCVAIEAELLAKRDEVSISANHSAARVAEVEAKLQEKASEVSLLKASNQQLIDALQGSGKQPQNADFERLSLEVTRLRQEKMELAVQLNSLALQFRGTDVDRERITEEHKNALAEHDRLQSGEVANDVRQEVERLRSLLEHREKEIESLNGKNIDVSEKLAKVTADVTSLEIAQHKCEVQDQELRSLRTQMREASSRHASELSQLKGQVRALTGDLAEEQGKVEALVDTLTHAQQQAEANVRQLQVEIDALTMEKATTQGQTDSLRQTLQQQARKLTEAKETIGSLSGKATTELRFDKAAVSISKLIECDSQTMETYCLPGDFKSKTTALSFIGLSSVPGFQPRPGHRMPETGPTIMQQVKTGYGTAPAYLPEGSAQSVAHSDTTTALRWRHVADTTTPTTTAYLRRAATGTTRCVKCNTPTACCKAGHHDCREHARGTAAVSLLQKGPPRASAPEASPR